jgi:hypothetical protein
MKPPDDAVRSLSQLLLPVMRYRIEKLGVEASGAFNFYRSRLATDRVFCDYEVRLAERIAGDLPLVEEIHEIGCGWGQLVFLLAWCGYRATGFEIDSRRFAGADSLHRVLGQVDPEAARRATLRNEFFPPLDRPESRSSLVIATNVVVGNPRLIEEQMLWALRRYRYAIVDIDRFCRLRRPDERQDFIAAVEGSGLRNVGLFCDAGSDGQFYLFEREGDGDAERRLA